MIHHDEFETWTPHLEPEPEWKHYKPIPSVVGTDENRNRPTTKTKVDQLDPFL
jgi:hypothetical protein